MNFEPEIRIKNSFLMRVILVSAGTVLVGIGIIGIFLPLLPATIFFLLAAWCYARSSEKFYNWLHTNRLFGKYLRNYRLEKGMTMMTKLITIIFLWGTIVSSACFATDNMYIRVLLILIAVGVTWHLVSIKTLRKLE